jgi:hypothetical protein
MSMLASRVVIVFAGWDGSSSKRRYSMSYMVLLMIVLQVVAKNIGESAMQRVSKRSRISMTMSLDTIMLD